MPSTPPMLRLSCVQAPVVLGDVAANLRHAVATIESEARAVATGVAATGPVATAHLIVFPELSLTGYVLDARADAERLAETVPGPSTQALAEACGRVGVHALVGMIECGADGRLFNSAVFVGPRGVAATYRKTHLPMMGIDRFLDRGDGLLAPVDLGGTRVSCLICYDGTFPEPSRVLALAGADLLVLPTNWPNTESLKGDFMPATRALENVVWFAAVNRVTTERGIEFRGNSSIVDPGGVTVARAGVDACVIRALIDPALAREKRRVTPPGDLWVDRFGDRRPDLYAPITQTPARNPG